MTSRPWTYDEKIRLGVGMRFGLPEALALEGNTIEELEAAAFRINAERVDDLESALQRKLAPKQNLGAPPSPPSPSLRSGSVSPGLDKPDPLAEALARKVRGSA